MNSAMQGQVELSMTSLINEPLKWNQKNEVRLEEIHNYSCDKILHSENFQLHCSSKLLNGTQMRNSLKQG